MEIFMKKITFDCDNTFGVNNCDVDDGLALLYLLGRKEANLIGITSCYGNSTIETTFSNTKRMLKEIGREDIPVYKGEEKPNKIESPAAKFLAEQAQKFKGELSILATGSLTNLWAAAQIDPNFFSNLKEIVLMGGITEPLLVGNEKKEIKELNFSCDPKATLEVLTQSCPVSTATGNNCLAAYFTADEFKNRLENNKNGAGSYIYEKTGYWFGHADKNYKLDGFFNWDVVSAVYLMHPELFKPSETHLRLSEEDLKTGYLRINATKENANATIFLPKIKDLEAFKEEVYSGWLQAKIKIA